MIKTPLPIARYELKFQVTQDIRLPEYAGSALRGAFGRALRNISCMTKQDDCNHCPLYRSCPYTNIFETPAPKNHNIQKFKQVPNGYIIEPPKWGDRHYPTGAPLKFSLVLIGKLIEHLPLIAFAFKRALSYNLSGGKAQLQDILHCENQKPSQSIFIDDCIINHDAKLHLPDPLPKNLTLNIHTPLRLQENGKPLNAHNITLERFLISLAKRISLLFEFHATPLHLDFPKLIEQIPKIKHQAQLRWQDWTRYSSRQQQKMKLGGLIGEWQLQDVPKDWANLIYIGQWLHNGKNATFGLGNYQIEKIL